MTITKAANPHKPYKQAWGERDSCPSPKTSRSPNAEPRILDPRFYPILDLRLDFRSRILDLGSSIPDP